MDSPEQAPPGGDRNRGPIIIAVTSVVILISTVTILLRIYTRAKLIHNIGLDDYTVLLAWTLCWLGLACHIVEVCHGLGRHAFYLSMSNIASIGKWELVSQIQNVLAVTFTKLSATLLILRLISGGISKSLRWSLHALMLLLVTIAIITILADSLQCIPIAASWDPSVKGRCLHPTQVLGFAYALGGFTILTDVICAAFPVLVFRKLQMNRRKKIALSFVMSMGLLTAACASVKVSYLKGIKANDPSWGSLDVDMWAMIEQNVGVFACSIPALYPLIKSGLKSKKSRNKDGRTKMSLSFLSSWHPKKAKFFVSTSQSSRITRTKEDTGSVSEERILPPVQDAIRKTTDIDLDFSSQKDTHDRGDGCIEMV